MLCNVVAYQHGVHSIVADTVRTLFWMKPKIKFFVILAEHFQLLNSGASLSHKVLQYSSKSMGFFWRIILAGKLGHLRRIILILKPHDLIHIYSTNIAKHS